MDKEALNSPPYTENTPKDIANYSEDLPAIQEIELDPINEYEVDGIKIVFQIKGISKSKFTYNFIRSGPLGDKSSIHSFTSQDYIGQLKGMDLKKLEKTPLGIFIPHSTIVYSKYSDKPEKKGALLTFRDILNNHQIPESAETFFKLNSGNPSLVDPDLNESINIDYAFNKFYKLDSNELKISDVEIKETSNGVHHNEKIFINAFPHEIKILQSPLLDRKINYYILWTSKSGRYPIPTEGNPKAIINQLDHSGLILDEYKAHNKLAYILNWMAEKNIIKKEYGIKEPGFHLLEGKIISVEYDCQDLPEPEDLKKSLEILEEFGSYFKTNNYDIRDKVATIFKLTLLNPFDYVKKQLDYDREIVFPYGSPGTAKTTLLQLPRFVYNIPKDYFIESGGAANTPAQISGLMTESTFPKMVDEAENIFRKPELVSLNKQAMNSLYSRKIRDKNQHEKIQPSYATLLYNSNEIPFKLSKDGSVRRYSIIHFDENLRPSEDEKEDFKYRWKSSDKGQFQEDTPLKELKYIGQFVAYYIINNPESLKKDIKTLTDELVDSMYAYAGLGGNPSLWLKDWCDLEDEKSFRSSENQKIIYFMKKAIESAHKNRIQEVNEDYRPENTFDDDDIHGPEFYYRRLFEVANNPALPWLGVQKIGSETCYLINNGILEEISKEVGLNISLNELESRFKPFQNKPLRLKNKESMGITDKKSNFRMIRVLKKDFEELLYPELSNN